jgi:hypothetical protein
MARPSHPRLDYFKGNDTTLNLYLPLELYHRLVYNNNNSVALVHEQTIPTELPPLVVELVSTFADRGVSRGQRGVSLLQ